MVCQRCKEHKATICISCLNELVMDADGALRALREIALLCAPLARENDPLGLDIWRIARAILDAAEED